MNSRAFVDDVLGGIEPAQVIEVQWARRYRLSAYLGVFDIPDDLLVSVRCVVIADDGVVVCEDASGNCDILPGGRREAGESHADTACREVLEETGWTLDPDSLEAIGLIHLRNLGEPQPPFPFPDGIHLVLRGTGTNRPADGWVDTEGQVLRSYLVAAAEAAERIAGDGLGRVFLPAALREHRSAPC